MADEEAAPPKQREPKYRKYDSLHRFMKARQHVQEIERRIQALEESLAVARSDAREAELDVIEWMRRDKRTTETLLLTRDGDETEPHRDNVTHVVVFTYIGQADYGSITYTITEPAR
jgi:hypothetical protein